MNARITFATAARVLAQVRHDHRTIALMLVVPSLLLSLLAWLFSDTELFDVVGPALLGLFPFMVMFLVTSIGTLRERRSGTLERLLSMPLGKGDFILGYALAFGLMATLQAMITVAVAVWALGMTVAGELWLLVLVAVADALLGTALGLMASAFAATEFQVVQFMPAFIFPQLLLGGVLMPRDEMPELLYVISDWLPLSHAIEALNAVTREADGTADALLHLGVVGLFGLGALILGSLTLRRRTA